MSTWSDERRKLPWVTLSASEEEECRLWAVYEAAQVAASKAADDRHRAFTDYYAGSRSAAALNRLQTAQKRSEKADEAMDAAWKAWDQRTTRLVAR